MFIVLTIIILIATGGDVFLPFLILSMISGDSNSSGGGFGGGGGSFDGGGSSSDF